ncbi:MAG: hypothetical protein ACETWR_02710 [Anaerolineae bacterium]
MDNEQVSIVTDGMIDMAPELVSRLGIHIVPWRGTRKGSLWPPLFSSFIQTYHRLQPSPVFSIHPAGSLSDVGHSARLARNLLMATKPSGVYEQGVLKPLVLSSPAQRRGLRVKVFEAKAIDLGVRFMVTVAAQAAQEGYNEEQLDLLLRRLQDEMMQTMILTKDTSHLGRLLAPQGMSVRKKKENLIYIDKERRAFSLVAQAESARQYVGQPEQFLRGVPQPCDLWIRQRGYDSAARQLIPHWKGLFQVEQVHTEAHGLGAGPYFGGDYLEVVFCPTGEAIERLKRFVKRMWKAFGSTTTATASSQQ